MENITSISYPIVSGFGYLCRGFCTIVIYFDDCFVFLTHKYCLLLLAYLHCIAYNYFDFPSLYTAFPDDFTTSSSSLMFNMGTMEDQSLCTTVTVEMDAIQEPEEQAVVRIQDDASYTVNGNVGGLSEFVVITIVDNDSGK